MKSLIRKKQKEVKADKLEEAKKVKVAQCCAKISKNVVGCHD